MPNKDKTGPQGKGPKTGRGLGNCEPRNNLSSRKQGLGRKNRSRRQEKNRRNF